MAKVTLFILLFFAGGASAAQGVKDCHVGADPWFMGRQVDHATEAEYVLTKPLVLESLNKEGKPSGLCTLAAGEHIVVPFGFDASINHPFATREEKMKLAWVKRCGNPIVSRFRFVVPQKAEATPVVPVAAVPPAQPVESVPQVEQKDFYDVAVFPEATPKLEEKVAQPTQEVVRRYVFVSPRVRHYGWGWPNSGYGYGTTGFVPQPQYTPSQYYMSPNIRYPDPAPFVPQPQHITGPSFVTGPATSGPSFTTGPATSGPSFTTR